LSAAAVQKSDGEQVNLAKFSRWVVECSMSAKWRTPRQVSCVWGDEGLTFPPPIWGTRALGIRTDVPSMTMKCWNPSMMASAAHKTNQFLQLIRRYQPAQGD
jgi:hypothetical protein